MDRKASVFPMGGLLVEEEVWLMWSLIEFSIGRALSAKKIKTLKKINTKGLTRFTSYGKILSQNKVKAKL